MGERVEWIADPDRLAALAEPWERMLPEDALPFDRHCWFEAWWRGFGTGEPAVCAAWRGAELAAVLPMTRRGARLESMANVHTPAFRPLARDRDALSAVVEATLGSGAPTVRLVALASDYPSLPLLERAAGEARRDVLLERDHLSPIVDTRGDYASWVEQTKRRWETNIPRLRRKMAREHHAELHLVRAPSDLEGELERGFRVEASGWKGRSGTAILSSPQTATFYRELAHRFHARGELRLSTILLDGQAVAFDLSLLDGHRLYLLKTGYDERFRKLAPGLVLRLATIEHCFESGLEAHELLGDDAPWKRKFSTSERLHCSLRAYSRRPIGRLLYQYRKRARPALRWVYRRALQGTARRSACLAPTAAVPPASASPPQTPSPTATVSSPSSPVAKRSL